MIDPTLVELVDGPHRTYARHTAEARGRVTVEITGHRALVFERASGRLVSPRGFRPPYRLARPEPPNVPSPPRESESDDGAGPPPEVASTHATEEHAAP